MNLKLASSDKVEADDVSILFSLHTPSSHIMRGKLMRMSYVDEIKRYYSEWWENPNDIRNVVFESLNEYVRCRIPPGNGGKALDIGSGNGRIVSYLLEKGYKVTAVEFNEYFVQKLKRKFPEVSVIQEDVRYLNFHDNFDITTCIEVVQVINKGDLLRVLKELRKATNLLLINMSNRISLHGFWVEIRRFRKSFVVNYSPSEFDAYIRKAGFSIVHRNGIGLVTPISLFRDFKGKMIPIRVAKTINKLDRYATSICHLYYVEAI